MAIFAPSFIKVLDLNLPKIQKGQVLVKIKYSSICHTQIQEIMGTVLRSRGGIR